MTIEQAVQAYIKAFGNTPRTKDMALKNEQKVRHALTAAIPFLPVQGAVKKLEDWQLDQILTGVKSQVNHNGWEEPYVRNRLRFELERILSALEPSPRDELMKQIREGTAYGFLNDGSQPEGNPDLDCPYCCGSGHKGDVQPSAARDLALEEAAQFIESHIYTSSPDGVRLVPSKRAGLDLHHQTIAAAIRALSSPDHADAGKVEGDVEKWSIREIVAKAIAYHSVGDPHAKTIRGDQRWKWFLEEADKFISVFGYYLPALPSAPSQEVA